MRKSTFISGILLLALAPALVAQSTANWDSVKQLTTGKEIRVTLNDGRNLRGTFQSATDEALTVAIPNSQEALSRTMVIRIASKGKGHRLRNSLIGLGVGAGAGLIAGAVADRCPAGHGCWFPNVGKEILTPFGAAVGAIVGALIPTGRWRDVYRVK